MSDNDDYEVENQDSGAKDYEFVQTSTLKRGSYIIIKDQPCKVDSISTSKPGKHGSAKCAIVAKNIFNGSRHDEISQAHATVKCPKVTRAIYQLMNIDDDHLDLMHENGSTRCDIRVPSNELGDKIREGFDEGAQLAITILSSMGIEEAIESKEIE